MTKPHGVAALLAGCLLAGPAVAGWHAECKKARRKYHRNLEAVCGGPPGPATAADYRKRSPLFHLAAGKGLPLDIQAGIHAGHTGSVPVSHSLRAFNALAKANGCPEKQIADADVAWMVANRRVPEHLAAAAGPAAGRRRHKVLFHRTAGAARVTLFDGGHESDVPAALDWLARQHRGETP